MASPIDLITITREFGAGGGELAATLGARLGWTVLDRDIVRRTAERLGVDEEAIAARDEHAPGLLERLGTTILRTSPEIISVPPDDVQALDPDRIAGAVREVLRAAAAAGPAVIVGHGAAAIFADHPRALHVKLVAPLAQRAARICARVGCHAKEAFGLAPRVDAERVSYMRQFYGRDWRDPMLFDLQINTGRVTIDDAAALIESLAASHASREAMAHG